MWAFALPSSTPSSTPSPSLAVCNSTTKMPKIRKQKTIRMKFECGANENHAATPSLSPLSHLVIILVEMNAHNSSLSSSGVNGRFLVRLTMPWATAVVHIMTGLSFEMCSTKPFTCVANIILCSGPGLVTPVGNTAIFVQSNKYSN